MAIVSTLPQFPNIKVKTSLFQNVSNAGEIQSKVAQLRYAVIDVRLICSLEQVYAAIYQALLKYKYGKLKTRSLHSECIYCLSATSNIAEAYRNFGIKNNSRVLLAIQVGDNEDQLDRLELEGDEITMNDENLRRNCDMDFIVKIYKLNILSNSHAVNISRAVVNCIQLRGL